MSVRPVDPSFAGAAMLSAVVRTTSAAVSTTVRRAVKRPLIPPAAVAVAPSTRASPVLALAAVAVTRQVAL